MVEALKEFCVYLECLTPKGIKVVDYMLTNMNKANQIVLSASQISDRANISLVTVQRTLHKLCNPPSNRTEAFLIKINQNCYEVNTKVFLTPDKRREEK